MTTYLGVDVLDITPDREPQASAHVSRFATLVDDPAGAFAVAWGSREQVWERTFVYNCHSWAEVDALKTFLANRAGCYAPCWVPTWDDDLVLTVVPSSIAQLTARYPGISAFALIGTLQMRHVAILPVSGGLYPMKPGAAINNGDGTITINTDSGYAGPALAIDRYRVSVLKYARLASDEVLLGYSNPGVVTATLRFVELPYETP